MIVCPNCNHSNPDGAQACEACYTPLPSTTSCPNCGASVQTDATFCGQCGSNLHPNSQTGDVGMTPEIHSVPDLTSPEPLVQPEPLVATTPVPRSNSSPNPADPLAVPPTAISVPSPITSGEASAPPTPPVALETVITEAPPPTPATPELVTSEQLSIPAPPTESSKTQLQQQTAKLLHVQTNAIITLPQELPVIHIGKSNDRIPPDVDVSGFPNSEIVSRIHADIRVEGGAYYIEDVGSSNGTYINNLPLLPGNRHRLRAGDRVALGKGDLVTLIFQS